MYFFKIQYIAVFTISDLQHTKLNIYVSMETQSLKVLQITYYDIKVHIQNNILLIRDKKKVMMMLL